VVEYALKLVNGVPRMREVSNAGTGIYDDTYVVGPGGLTASTAITLPNGGTYDDSDLEVFIGGQFLEPGGVDYNYVGSGPDRTQISFVENLLEGERIHFRTENANVPIYDEVLVVGGGGITTGSNITLPNGGTYEGVDLEIYLNGEFLEKDLDWNQVGSIPRTQIQMTFDLVQNDRLRFRIDHAL
jgi:hypothetical protein